MWDVFVSHPRLRADAVEDRDYQRTLAARIIEAPHLVVLPTGLGKTVIALRAILHFLEASPGRRILILAPTKPLCDQHARYLREILIDVPVAIFTGEMPPGVRDAQWASSRIIVATPQVIQNDIVRGTRDLSDVGFLMFDEAHRATGNFPYGFIARRYGAAGGRHACGLTASPGNEALSLQRILQTLRLERVEVRTERDPDVSPYVQEVTTDWIRVRPTLSVARTIKLLERMYARSVLGLRRLGYFPNLKGLPSRKDLVLLGHRQRADLRDGRAGRATYDALSLQARALKLQHGLELAETQGSASAAAFLKRLEAEATSLGGSKAARDLIREPEFQEALALARDDPEPSPKIARIHQLVRDALAAGDRRVLVFAHFRDTADAIVEALRSVPEVTASRFVGHSKAAGGKGQTKREQQDIVERFRRGDLNVLVATAVGEEGLDLPETDAVVLHEPLPSSIRLVQRRGRTGRSRPGKLHVLMTEGTRDEVYHWSALRRERKMHGALSALRRVSSIPQPSAPGPARPLPAPPPAPLPPSVGVTIEPREASSPVARALVERGIRIQTAALPTGDYSIGGRVLVERKAADDFHASLRDGRLFDQLPRLGQAGVGILLVEGDPFKCVGGVSAAALSGALAAAAVDHRVSVIVVPDADASADFLVSLARRVQRTATAAPLRIERAPRTPDQQIQFVIEGLPLVGPVLARNLLERFGGLPGIVAASSEDLAQTRGLGLDRARALHDLLHRRVGADASPSTAFETAPGVATSEGGEAPAR